MAADFGPSGIRVNAIALAIKTDIITPESEELVPKIPLVGLEHQKKLHKLFTFYAVICHTI